EDVETLDDEDVGTADDHFLALDHVIDEVGVDRDSDLFLAGFDIGEEVHKAGAIVAFRKALAVHQIAALELGIGIEKAVGGNEIDTRARWPAREQGLQDTGGGGFSHRNRAGDPNDE